MLAAKTSKVMKYEVNDILANNRIVLDWKEYIKHYSISFWFLSIPLAAIIYGLFKDGIFSSERFAFLNAIFLPISILMYYLQYRKLSLTKLETNYQKEQNYNNSIEAIKIIAWHNKYKSKDLIIASSGFSWKSWGERITIIPEDKVIYINSICNSHQALAWGKNTDNVLLFRNTIDKLSNT